MNRRLAAQVRSDSTRRKGLLAAVAASLALLAMSVAFGLVGIDRFILPPLFPAIMKDLSLGYENLGWLVAVLGIAWGASAILTGFMSDHLGRRAILVPSVVIFSLLSVFSGMATGLVSLLFTFNAFFAFVIVCISMRRYCRDLGL